MSIAGQPAGRFTMGLFGKNSPEIVGNFLKVLNGEGQSASYVYSTVWRVLDGYCIDMGRVVGGGGKKLKKEINESGVMRIKTGNAADWTRNTEINELKHVEPFLLTMKRGGGTYEFSVTTQANEELDKDHVVFGRLLMKEGGGEEKYRKGNEEVIESILKVKVSTDDPIASKKIFAAAGKGFDPRAKIIYLNKPLQKIVVTGAGTL
jgi:cyclophilin family peptidyl-prolyl cis-trans isomerase